MKLLKEIWDFLKVRKFFWLAPIIIVMLIFGGMLILAQIFGYEQPLEILVGHLVRYLLT